MTHLLDSSAVLAYMFGEPGADRVDELLNDPSIVAGISVLSLYESYTTILHRSGSDDRAVEALTNLREAVSEIVAVDEVVVNVALDLRRKTTARIALADCLIAATAARHGSILVHRDPHFTALAPNRPVQETLPDKL